MIDALYLIGRLDTKWTDFNSELDYHNTSIVDMFYMRIFESAREKFHV